MEEPPVETEAIGADLTPRQQRFVEEYLVDLNATQAAIRAGYSPKTANEQGSRLLSYASVSAAVLAGQKAKLDTTGITAERTLKEISRLAFQDPRAYWDADGNLKPITELNDDEAAAVASIEVLIKNAQAGDGKTDTVHKLQTWDKTKNLELLARHLGLLKDIIKVEGADAFVLRLQSARNRAKK